MSAAIVPDSQWRAPATTATTESLTRVQNIIGDFDTDHTMKYYDDWSEHYERDLENLDYTVPDEMVAAIRRFLSDEEWQAANFQVLDIGLGTGQMALALRRYLNYNGHIDGVDGNDKMMEKAREKGLYGNLQQHILLENSPMPHASNKYDVVVCCCAMVPALIQPECIPDMVRVVKPGGVFFFTTRSTDGNQSFKDRVDRQLNKLESEGYIEMLTTKIIPQYSWPTSKEGTEKHCISAILYGVKKIKMSNAN